jgi:hypothetical protein
MVTNRARTTSWLAAIVSAAALAAASSAASASPAPGDGAGGPVFDPAGFVAEIDNPYLPLVPGTTFVYRGRTEDGPERNVVTVTRRTVRILGVEARVVLDEVWIGGKPVERTFDWYAQDRAGNVWYLGERSLDFERGRWVVSDGSWRAGVDGAEAGIVMWARPLAKLNRVYQQELYPGHAEDRAKVRGTRAAITVPYGTFDDVLVTSEWTPLEPGVVERKLYAPEVGLVAARQVKGGSDTLELVSVRRN